ncbi:hypothetical protein WICANDRAFT_32579 [Wickerhamomyces anomalus NRRL Y-366-8]|uniref:Mitochondrial import inner membrane translocase subunit n=1 Tax=Wickerhamomyces anomalus (strain ATCC 58044 / CBS 1984 / NCYC 433 / NRRL Y-366-8) TaxID=683960 RepID=A0A1E3P1N5_WICAA|nr:uncharacterized protein WICANDRAFT_32579 [Wickerhamomyces anomalus NRRL Y-366-8]ODQ59396.1 hypothetical protein WICANDRAFT_32579 [Wickerhamomyces anomalus NRRL Y-366-8]
MSFILKSAYMNQDADPEKIKMAEVQFDAMSKTFNTMLKSCRNKCIPDEYGEADLNKGEMMCIDRCVAKYYKTNLKIGQVSAL